MPGPWSEEFIWATTTDGIEHDGAIWRPSEPKADAPVVLWVHGAGGSFSGRRFVLISRWLAARGYPSMTGNNRGHDMGTALRRPGVGEDILGGVWWERLSDAPLDIAAWLDKAEELGHRRIVLAGCSYGPIKTVLYQSQHQDPRVVGMVLASTPVDLPRLRRRNLPVRELARQMEAAGRGQDLFPWGSVGGGFMNISAATLLDRWATAGDVYGVEQADGCPISRITCPILSLCGTAEPEILTPDEQEIIRRNATSSPRVDTAVIEGMPHTYRGFEDQAAEIIHRWLRTLEDTQATFAEAALAAAQGPTSR